MWAEIKTGVLGLTKYLLPFGRVVRFYLLDIRFRGDESSGQLISNLTPIFT